MTGLWSAALWIIKTAFELIDSFTNPDLTSDGPMREILPTTLWIGATLAVIMMFVQLTLALIRRDGESMGRIFMGMGQFGLVWVGYLGLAAGMVAAAAGLSKGILSAMLHVQSMHEYNFDSDLAALDRRHHPGDRPGRAVAAAGDPGGVLLHPDHAGPRGRADHPGGHLADLGRRAGRATSARRGSGRRCAGSSPAC